VQGPCGHAEELAGTGEVLEVRRATAGEARARDEETQMKTTYLEVGGTISYTLRRGPSRIEWSGEPSPVGFVALVGRRKPLLRWWRELAAWHLWRRWRKTRITSR
jgi:hypothetical protein